MQTSDGGYLASSEVIATTYRGLRFIKTNALGDTLWTRLYKKDSMAYYSGLDGSLINSIGGGFAMAGTILDIRTTNDDGLFVKINVNGDTLLTKKFATPFWEVLQNCIQNPDGTYILAGGSQAFSGGGNTNMWLVKTDSLGNVLWQKNYGGSGEESVQSMIKTNDGGYALAGYTNSFGAGSYDLYIVKVDSAGNFQWDKTLGGSLSEGTGGISQTSNGDYLIVGEWHLTGTDADAYIARLNSGGGLIWQKWYGDSRIDYFGCKPIELTDGSIVALGIISDTVATYHPKGWIMKLNSLGDSLWSRKYAKWNGPNFFTNFKHTTDNGFIISGYASNSLGIGGGEDSWLIKIDSLGCDSVGCVYNTGINELAVNYNYKIYPNPNDGNMTYEYELKGNEKGELIIYNSIGQLINKYALIEGSNSLQISETDLENGIYFYQEIINGKIIVSDKLVIIK